MHNEIYNRGVANTPSLHDIWDFSVIREVLFVLRDDLRASDIPPFQTAWLSQRLAATETFVWRLVLLFGSCSVTWTSRMNRMMTTGLARLPAPPKLWFETKDDHSIWMFLTVDF